MDRFFKELLKMKNTSNESLIPRETIVVEYVAGNLSERARQKFELSMQGDTDLQEAVEFERSLRGTAKKVVANFAGRSDQYTASDNFEALLDRVEKRCLGKPYTHLEKYLHNELLQQRNPL